MKVTLVLEQNLFPLYDGLRKQVWFHALELKKIDSDLEIEIINLSKGESYMKEGIKIINKNRFNFFFLKTDILHYFGSPSPVVHLLLLISKYKKFFINITDGAISEFWKSIFSIRSVGIINKKVKKIFYLTNFQGNILLKYFSKNKLIKTIPYIEDFKQIKEKSKNPRLLFMSHLSEYKGIGDLLEAYNKMLVKIPKLELVIANSGLNKNNEEYYRKIDEINKNGGNIFIKNKIFPEEELSKAWIYIYTFKKVVNTMAVPISLYEAVRCNTFYISSDIGGVSEYFSSEFLIKEINKNIIYDKLIFILENYNNLSINKSYLDIGNNSCSLIYKSYLNE